MTSEPHARPARLPRPRRMVRPHYVQRRYPHRLSRLIDQLNQERRQYVLGVWTGAGVTLVFALILSH